MSSPRKSKAGLSKKIHFYNQIRKLKERMPWEQLELIDAKAIRFSFHLPSLFFLPVSFIPPRNPYHTTASTFSPCSPYPQTGFQCSPGPHGKKLDFTQFQSLKSCCLGMQPNTGFFFLVAVCKFLRETS